MSTLLNQVKSGIAPQLRTLTGRHTLPEPKSNGYHASFKVTDAGKTYQVSAAAWIIHSKTTGAEPKADVADVATALEQVAAAMTAKTFSSKKVGSYAQGKAFVDGQALQLSVQAVQITK